jgi:hypothetical protein
MRLTRPTIAVLALLALCAAHASLRADPAKFIRFVDDNEGGGKLETSVVSYKNEKGDVVDLIGAVHIGDKPYFAELSRRFDGYEAVLYELVKPADDDNAAANAAAGTRKKDPGVALRMVGGMQKFMKDVLKLSFQLEQIDYKRKNFVHADLTLEEFQRLQGERGEGFMQMFIAAMLNPPEGKVLEDQPTLPELLQAMGAPDRDRRLKMIFARQLQHADALTQQLEGPDGSVILTERNKKAIATLDSELAAGRKHVAIFYGAAHLDGMEGMLAERGFKQVGDPQWITAWDMTANPPIHAATKPSGGRLK